MMNDDPKLVAERDAKLKRLGSRPPWWRPFVRLRWKQQRAAILAMDVSQAALMLRGLYSTAYLEQLASMPSPAFGLVDIAKEPSDSHAFRYEVYRRKRDEGK
jgi:hypothetical protein